MSATPQIADRFRAALGEAAGLCGIGADARIGLAVSGGSDSMALMHLVAASRPPSGPAPVVLCFDHAIEGENSKAEAEFVRESAAALSLEFFSKRSDPPVRAGNGLSIEMAARKARLAFFAEAARALGLAAIATGHQRDDVAETLLLRLLRGSGAAGLSGMRPATRPCADGPWILRPLLGFGRDELRDFLRARSIRWMEDVANGNESIPRCRVRLRLMPHIAEALGRPEDEISAAIAQSAAILRDEDSFAEAAARELGAAIRGDGGLETSRLRKSPAAIARRVARKWLMENAGPQAAGFHVVEALLSAAPGAAVNIPGGKVVDVDGAGVAHVRTEPERAPAPAKIPIPGTATWGPYSVSAEISDGTLRHRETPGVWPACCTISLDAVEKAGGIAVRSRLPGDRITPFGMAGARKLQDVFVDCKIPAGRRGGYPVIATRDSVAWVPGYRIAAQFAVPPGRPSVKLTVKARPPDAIG